MKKEKNSAAALVEMAAGMAFAAKEGFGYDLDYSLESLVNVERILTRMKKRMKPHELAVGFGCYVGEVMIRSGNGKWIHNDDDSEWVVDLPEGVRASPITRCHKFIVNGKNDGIEIWGRTALALSRQQCEAVAAS